MSKIIRVVVPIVFAVIGTIIGGPLGGSIGSLIGTIAVSLIIPPSKGKPRAAVGTSLQIGEVPRQAIVGRAATPGSLVDAFNYGGKYGTDWEVMVIALADHRCDALEGFYVNDAYVAFGADGLVAGYSNQLAVYWRSGTEAQTVPAVLTTNGPGWTANDNGAGVAYVVVAYKADASDAKNPVWTNGRPKFLWVLRGARCYDSRKDSTAGGVGSHRWLTPSTWEWTDNPIVARYNFARGFFACDRVTQPEQLVVGRGLSAVEAPPENVFARANLCDELVDGEKRYRAGGTIIANETFIEVENDFAAACAGTISQPEGAVEIDPGAARAAVVTITDKDLVVGSKVKRRWFLGEGDRGWVNTVVPSYIEPAHKWSAHAAPVRRDVADVIADRGSREETVSLGFVTWIKQAGRVGEIVRRLGRLQIRAELVLPPRFCELEEGDWIIWQSDRYLGGAAYTFRVDGWTSDKAWHHSVQLRQISASCYSDVAPLSSGSVAVNQAVPGAVGAPAGGSWAVAAGYMEASDLVSPALIVTGAVDNSFARFVRFEYYRGTTAPSGATVWSDGAVTGPDVTRREIPVAANDTYRVAVSYVVDGIQGDRLILGPVVTGAGATNDGDRRDPNVLSMDEKIRMLLPKEERREIEYTDWTTRATALGTAALTTGIGSVNTKRTAWLALRNAIAPAWNTVTANSPIARTAYDTADREYDDMLSWLKTLISEEDSRRSEWATTTGLGRPESNATAADNIIVNGSLSDGTRGYFLNPTTAANYPRVSGAAGEPGAYFRATGTTDIRCNDAQPILGAFGNARCYLNMTSLVPDRSTQVSYYQIWEYDAVGGLLVNPATDMTPPVAGVFQNVRKAFQFQPNTARIVIFIGAGGATVGNPVKFGDFRVSFTERDADVTITAQVTTLPPPDIEINATYTGVIITSPTQFNKVVTPSVLSGGLSVRTDARASYTVTDVTSGLAGFVSVNSTAGSADKGRVTVTNATSSGTFKLNIFWSGVQIAAHVVALTVIPADPPAPTGGGGGGGGGGGTTKSGTASISGWGTNLTAFTEVARVSSLTKAAGETIKCALAAAGYSLTHSVNSNRVMKVKFQYSVAAANSWTDLDVAVNGSPATYFADDYGGEPGYVTCNQSVAPANAVYDVRLIAAMGVSGGSLAFESGQSFSVVVEP